MGTLYMRVSGCRPRPGRAVVLGARAARYLLARCVGRRRDRILGGPLLFTGYCKITVICRNYGLLWICFWAVITELMRITKILLL